MNFELNTPVHISYFWRDIVIAEACSERTSVSLSEVSFCASSHKAPVHSPHLSQQLRHFAYPWSDWIPTSSSLSPHSLGFFFFFFFLRFQMELICLGRSFFDLVVCVDVAPSVTHPCHLSFAFREAYIRTFQKCSGNPIISHLCKQLVVSVAWCRNVVSSPSISVFFRISYIVKARWILGLFVCLWMAAGSHLCT